jgi:hypothetical protein
MKCPTFMGVLGSTLLVADCLDRVALTAVVVEDVLKSESGAGAVGEERNEYVSRIPSQYCAA